MVRSTKILNVSVTVKDIQKLESIKETLGIPSRSETIRRIIDRAFCNLEKGGSS